MRGVCRVSILVVFSTALIVHAQATIDPNEGLKPYDPTTMQYALTPEQAADRVRAWIGDPSLELLLKGVYRRPVRTWTEWYRFDSGAGQQEFDVNCNEGWIRQWIDREAVSRYAALRLEESQGTVSRRSQQEIIDAALTFVRSRDPNWDSHDMLLSPNGLSGLESRNVLFIQSAGAGVLYPERFCSVGVNPFTLEIMSHLASVAAPPAIDTAPTLSQSDAVAQALSFIPTLHPGAQTAYLHPIEGFGVTLEVLIDDFRQPYLTYGVPLVWSDQPNLSYEECATFGHLIHVIVNPHSGAYIRHVDFLGSAGGPMPKLKPHGAHFTAGKRSQARIKVAPEVRLSGRKMDVALPPLLRKDRLFWYAGYLSSVWWKGTVERTGPVLRLCVDDRELVVRDGELSARLDGRPVRLSAAPFQKAGRSYLPVTALAMVTRDRFAWNRGSLEISGSRMAWAPLRLAPEADPAGTGADPPDMRAP